MFILWSKLWKRLFLHLNVIYFISDYAIHVEHLFQCLIVLILSSFISCDDFQASLSTRPAITLIPVVFFRHKNHKNKITCTQTHTHTQTDSRGAYKSCTALKALRAFLMIRSFIPSCLHLRSRFEIVSFVCSLVRIMRTYKSSSVIYFYAGRCLYYSSTFSFGFRSLVAFFINAYVEHSWSSWLLHTHTHTLAFFNRQRSTSRKQYSIILSFVRGLVGCVVFIGSRKTSRR